MSGEDICLYVCSFAQKALSHRYLEQAVADYAAREKISLPVPPPSAFFSPDEDGAVWPIRTGEHGKPYFPDIPGLHFSISHSGDYWVCAVSQRPVGTDLQKHQRKAGQGFRGFGSCHTERIAARFFHPDEGAYLSGGGSFFDVWSAKESYVKYTGRGIGDDFAAFAVADGSGLLSQVAAPPGLPAASLLHLPFRADYSLCLCADRIGNVSLLPLEPVQGAGREPEEPR